MVGSMQEMESVKERAAEAWAQARELQYEHRLSIEQKKLVWAQQDQAA